MCHQGTVAKGVKTGHPYLVSKYKFLPDSFQRETLPLNKIILQQLSLCDAYNVPILQSNDGKHGIFTPMLKRNQTIARQKKRTMQGCLKAKFTQFH